MAIRPITILAQFRRVILVAGVSALCGVLLAGIALPVVAGLGITARESANAFSELPSELQVNDMRERSRIVDSEGRTLAYFYDNETETTYGSDGNRIYVPLKNIAPVMIDAILAIEDDRFYDRGPIDLQGVLRAFIENTQEGEITGGGSTLTQQYVKQVRITQAESSEEVAEATVSSNDVEGYRRKLEELRMAVAVEQEYSKDEILERYLNIAYFGNGAYGVETAARTYFGKSAKKLTLRESALLAGLVQNPTTYDPVEEDSKQRAINRRDTVLNRMVETDRISAEKAEKAKARNLGLDYNRPKNGCVDSWAGYFCDYVYHELMTMKELGETRADREQALLTGGLTITTTLDRPAQRSADENMRDRVNPTDDAIGSLAAVEPGTGYIKAMANSRKYGVDEDEPGVSQINYAADWSMGGSLGIQPGSTFKVYVLAAAISQGIGLNASIRAPSQLSYAPDHMWQACDRRVPTGDVTWTPGNYEGAAPGTYNLRTGTEQSVNTFFIQLEERTGLCEPAMIAQDTGIEVANAGATNPDTGEKYEPELLQVPSFTLGVNLVSPVSMAESYATFANRGVHCDATSIIEIKGRDGDVLVDHTDPKCKRVMDKKVADTVTSVLQGVVDNGTGQAMQLSGRPAAGKTGTTNESRQVWFAGYTRQLATAATVADIEGEQNTLTGRTLGGEYVPYAGGSTLPGPVWQAFMEDYHEGLEVRSFPEPDADVVRGETETVPDVRGRSVEDARASLSDAGFSSYEEEEDSDTPRGTVIRTEPGAGSEVTKGSNIKIVVSTGNAGGNDNGNENGDEGGDGGGENGGENGGPQPPGDESGDVGTESPTPSD